MRDGSEPFSKAARTTIKSNKIKNNENFEQAPDQKSCCLQLKLGKSSISDSYKNKKTLKTQYNSKLIKGRNF